MGGRHHDDCDADVRHYLGRVTDAYREHLTDHLVAVWLVGSLAFGCYNRALSDLDLLVVVNGRPDLDALRSLARACVALTDVRPALGDQETSVVERSVLDPVLHPTPHVFQYSASWTERYRSTGFEPYEGEADPDVVAHAAVALRCGVTLHGPPPTDLVGSLSWSDFVDSLRADLRWIVEGENLAANPVYGVLNACRILMALAKGKGTVVGKAAGADWALRHLPPSLRPLVGRARDAYAGTTEVAPEAWATAGQRFDPRALREFAAYVRPYLAFR